MMKSWFFGMVFIFLHAISVYPVLAQEKQGPNMVLREQAYDFKEVKEGEVIEHSFEVRNEGDQVLKIIRVKPG